VTVAEALLDGLARSGVERIFTAPAAPAGPLLAAAAGRGVAVACCGSARSACIAAAVTGMLARAPGVAVVDVRSSRAGPIPSRRGSPSDAGAGAGFARRNRGPLILLDVSDHDAERAGELEEPVKGTVRVTPTSVGHQVIQAVRLALAEPRGPVRLIVPGGELGTPALTVAAAPGPVAVQAPAATSLDAAAALIGGAARPVVVAGRGCRREDAQWLRAFMEAIPAPVFTTATARGAVPEPHPLALGVVDGARPDHPAIGRADLIITVVVDRGELPGWSAGSKAHVDLARSESEPVGSAVARVVGEPGAIFAELASRLAGRSRADWDVAELSRVKRGAAVSEAPAGRPAPGSSLAPCRIVGLARELTPAGAIASFDGGRAWAAQRGWQAMEPGDCLVPADRRARGSAIPGAIAAALASPGRQVLAFVDGGGLLDAVDDLASLKRLGLPVVVVVLDAGTDPDALRLAHLSGLPAHEATDAESAARALATALASAQPSVVAVRGAAEGEPSPQIDSGPR
jgi:thiamine pyrophosphate-dependent acetolactate synthase large subunit-like protein